MKSYTLGNWASKRNLPCEGALEGELASTQIGRRDFDENCEMDVDFDTSSHVWVFRRKRDLVEAIATLRRRGFILL